MAAPIKLTYFDVRGLAEIARLCLVAGNIPFTDERLTYVINADNSVSKGDWESTRKDKMPFQVVPVLTLPNGTMIGQSGAIMRYIAKIAKLNGANDVDAALLDVAYESLVDLRRSFWMSKSDASKFAEYWSKTLPLAVCLLAKNAVAGAGPFYQGANISYADVAIFDVLWMLSTQNKEVVEAAIAANPRVQSIYNAVEKQQYVAKYLAARKVTSM